MQAHFLATQALVNQALSWMAQLPVYMYTIKLQRGPYTVKWTFIISK